MSAAEAVIVVVTTIFFPPLGVFLVTGCGADLAINILLTILGYFPGHIHAFYIEFIYYHREAQRREGTLQGRPRAPGIFSRRVQEGGSVNKVVVMEYGTTSPSRAPPPAATL
ncbi:hypothetical protein EDC01DRAFT_259010 [Geopyxis carbonaria]|nr:hypothetical protein EDC01DRAFT_259010 [Geopyxis carbonaria]